MALKTPLRPGETVLRDSRANLQRGIESVGGRLHLTNQRLIFESHRINVQRGATEIPLGEVTGVDRAWTKFLGVLPLAPNSIAVSSAAGEHRLVLPKRDEWLAAIEQARGPAA
jgi:hypothetical protein